MSGFRGYVVSIVVALLFIFFIYSFTATYLNATNPDSGVLDSKYKINSSAQIVKNQITTIQSNINKSSSDISTATVDPVSYLFLITQAAFEIPKQVFQFTINGIVLLPTILFSGLGGTGIGDLLIFTLAVIISILVVTLVLLAVKFIRTGESER